MTNINLFNYDLPESLIAATPTERREGSRLMCIDKDTGTFTHEECFGDIINYFNSGDLLILNNARVFPARLKARRKTGGKAEILLLRQHNPGKTAENENPNRWLAMIKASGTLKKREKLKVCSIDEYISITGVHGNGYFTVDFTDTKAVKQAISTGKMPLPPYIQKARRNRGLPEYIPDIDSRRYQTVYAAKPGAVAAPTAGLHFSENLLDKLRIKGIKILYLTLLVGPGTFMPVRTDNIEDHIVEPEFYEISEQTAREVYNALNSKNRVIATGTTCVRVLEHIGQTENWEAHTGWSDMYIYPPFRFKVIDALITNFHLPKSSLLMLVSAFAGRENILNAYEEAIKEKYRFYSYGDATFLY